jgi:hypothetical protein
MKDFKKMPKMACGGKVKKYEEGGEVTLSPAEKLKAKLANVNNESLNTLNDKLSDRSQRTQEVFNTHDHHINSITKGPMGTSRGGGGGGGGGAGYVPGSNNPFNPDSPLNRKKGGRVVKKVGTVKKNK